MESAATPGVVRVTSELSVEDCAFQRHLVEEVAIDIDVEGWVVLDEVARGLDGDSLGGSGNLQDQLDVDSHGRANLDTLVQGGKSFSGDGDPVGVKRHVGE